MDLKKLETISMFDFALAGQDVRTGFPAALARAKTHGPFVLNVNGTPIVVDETSTADGLYLRYVNGVDEGYLRARIAELETAEGAAKAWCKSKHLNPDFYYDGKYNWQQIGFILHDRDEDKKLETRAIAAEGHVQNLKLIVHRIAHRFKTYSGDINSYRLDRVGEAIEQANKYIIKNNLSSPLRENPK